MFDVHLAGFKYAGVSMIRPVHTYEQNVTDYPTEDGTCVRDYVHVGDLAISHVAAAKALAAGQNLEPVYNLSSGDGVWYARS